MARFDVPYYASPPLSLWLSMVALNTFLLLRLVCFSLLVYFSFIGLVFEAWNIGASTSANGPVPGAVVFLLITTCVLCVFIALALAELFRAKSNTATVSFECVWTGLMSTIHLGATIAVTAASPGTCHVSRAFCDVSTSAALILPVSWLTFLILIAYFFFLLVSSLALMDEHPNIWSTSVYKVAWCGTLSVPSKRLRSAILLESSDDDETWGYSKSKDLEMASSSIRPRRGVDAPFPARPPRPLSPETTISYADSLINVPHLPSKTYDTQTAPGGSRYIELLRESQTITRPGGTTYAAANTPRIDSFPLRVASDDLPIPLPHLSEWIKAV